MSDETKTSRRVRALADRAQRLGVVTYPMVLSHFLGGLEARTEKPSLVLRGPLTARATLDLLAAAVQAAERAEASLQAAASSALPLPTSDLR